MVYQPQNWISNPWYEVLGIAGFDLAQCVNSIREEEKLYRIGEINIKEVVLFTLKK